MEQWYSIFVEKEIPISSEKSSKADRLRAASRGLQDLPLERRAKPEEWNALTSDLTQDDLGQLKKMAQGHLERAVGAAATDPEDSAEEARAAVLLWPQDTLWTKEVGQSLRNAGWKGMDAEAFFVLLDRRIGKKSRGRSKSRWLWPLIAFLAMTPLGIWAAFTWGRGLIVGHPISQVQGPRNLESVFDTQGVKSNIQVAQSRMLIFPEATVAELSAWVTFPEHRVDVWEGSVQVLDPQGQTLTTRDVIFHASSEGSLEPGQGVAVFQQFDAWPWFDRVASFQVTTKRILAQPAKPKERKEIPFGGVELTAGYGLKVWLQDSRWQDRFVSKVHILTMELENTGLKPFAELQFDMIWRDDLGKTLKTLTFRPVSAFRTALPSGAKLGWTQETVFDTEVFPWAAGAEPHPVLELHQWQ